jgi:hypothetical protein
LGDAPRARELLAGALSINPYFSIPHAPTARRHLEALS